MIYDTQRIQFKRRQIEVGEEKSKFQDEHGKSEAGKSFKMCSGLTGGERQWLYQSYKSQEIKAHQKIEREYEWDFHNRYHLCERCGKVAISRKGKDAANRFCSNACAQAIHRDKWTACAKCLAGVGIGSKTIGRLLKISSGRVSRYFKDNQIIVQKPKSGSYWAEARKTNNKEKELWDKYEKAWMDEIKQNIKPFVDWGEFKREDIYQFSKIKKLTKKERNKIWREKNKEYLKEQKRKWLLDNPDKKRKYGKAAREACKNNPSLRIKSNFRKRFKMIMKSLKTKSNSNTRSLIGCSTDQLTKHLESKFTKRMSWDNYGTYWHVDHIIPVASFDHTKDNEVALCWHWTNLQPLEAKANMKKSNKITESQMQLLLCASH